MCNVLKEDFRNFIIDKNQNLHYIKNIYKTISKMQAAQDKMSKDYEPAIHRR